MRTPAWMIAASILLLGLGSAASADPGKDESGKSRERGYYSRQGGGVPGLGPDSYGYDRPRRAAREFKEEYDDGTCKVERKLEKSGEYKEEIKCRGGARPKYGYRY